MEHKHLLRHQKVITKVHKNLHEVIKFKQCVKKHKEQNYLSDIK